MFLPVFQTLLARCILSVSSVLLRVVPLLSLIRFLDHSGSSSLRLVDLFVSRARQFLFGRYLYSMRVSSKDAYFFLSLLF